MISKDILDNTLLSEILGDYTLRNIQESLGEIFYTSSKPLNDLDEKLTIGNEYDRRINVYGLMHLAKEKLAATGAYVSSYIDFGSELWFCQYKDIDSDGVVYSRLFNDEFEYNAVFKALHWYMQDK